LPSWKRTFTYVSPSYAAFPRIVLPKSLFEQVSDGPLQPSGPGRTTNGTVDTSRATVHGPFRIGAVGLADVEVRVSQRYPELYGGAPALKHFAVLIDQRSKSMALCPRDPSRPVVLILGQSQTVRRSARPDCLQS
jgi:hypothetical protein